MSKREFPPIHPGEILLEEFLKPLEISQYRLAKDISVDAVTDHRVSGIRDSIFEKPREIRRCPVEIGAHRIDQDIEGGLPA